MRSARQRAPDDTNVRGKTTHPRKHDASEGARQQDTVPTAGRWSTRNLLKRHRPAEVLPAQSVVGRDVPPEALVIRAWGRLGASCLGPVRFGRAGERSRIRAGNRIRTHPSARIRAMRHGYVRTSTIGIEFVSGDGSRAPRAIATRFAT